MFGNKDIHRTRNELKNVGLYDTMQLGFTNYIVFFIFDNIGS